VSLRLAETLGGLALAFDLTNAFPSGKVVRTAVLSASLAEAAALPLPVRVDAFWLTLLRYLGCTSYAHEQTHVHGGVDDHAMRWSLALADAPADAEDAAGAPDNAGRVAKAVARFRACPVSPGEQARSQCEASRQLATQLGLHASLLDGLEDVAERFDGKGRHGREGDAIALAARVLHVAEVAELARHRFGREQALALLRERAGGALDPRLVDVFVADAARLYASVDVDDVWPVFLAAEPGVPLLVGDRTAVARTFAQFADLKSAFTLGHSTRVHDLAVAAARQLGASEADVAVLGDAALLHDLGRVAIPNALWDHPGPLGADARERMHLHAYQTDRVLARGVWRNVARLASSGHERIDGGGYYRALQARELPSLARVLAAADVMAALTEDRPHRAAKTTTAATDELAAEVEAGHLDADAADAVIAAAGGLRRVRRRWPRGLSDREVEVLRLLARGKTNRDIGEVLQISPRTVQNHLAHAYDKLGVSTRAGAALFLVEQGLADHDA
jgi:HD-GYP domain-containing protein (c-di-GMP phosphodiesterase class II)